jgi:hypothetical protein
MIAGPLFIIIINTAEGVHISALDGKRSSYRSVLGCTGQANRRIASKHTPHPHPFPASNPSLNKSIKILNILLALCWRLIPPNPKVGG